MPKVTIINVLLHKTKPSRLNSNKHLRIARMHHSRETALLLRMREVKPFLACRHIDEEDLA